MLIGGEKARLFQEGKNTLAVTSHIPMTPLETCVASGDEVGATACQVALQQVPASETPDIRLMFNPEGLSNQELEKFVEVGIAEALEKLHQALSVHNKRLTFALQHKTGRSAVVAAQKKRMSLLQRLSPACERRLEQGQGRKQHRS